MAPATRVKICGITRLEDAELAVRLGADALGFVLWHQSPRAIGAAEAGAIARRIPAFVTRVGVVVNQPAGEVASALEAAGLDVVQLHGDESPASYRGVGRRLVRAMAMASPDDVVSALETPEDVMILADAADATRRGGTGQLANWGLAAEVARRRPLILAGGLTAENVADAIEKVKPWAVDVSSGVELAWHQDRERWRRFRRGTKDDCTDCGDAGGFGRATRTRGLPASSAADSRQRRWSRADRGIDGRA